MSALNLTSPGALTRPADASDATLVHRLYEKTPGYFDVISIPVPTLAEVKTDLETAVRDARRHTELVLLPPDGRAPHDAELRDPVSGRQVVGYLDYKLDYPDTGDATVNLLLIEGDMQGRGLGGHCVRDLEGRLRGRVRRVLASIYAQNPRARRFWERLGYAFAIDAKPVLDWYAKQLV
jgi:GNAT superfamily N-acetyltransferase